MIAACSRVAVRNAEQGGRILASNRADVARVGVHPQQPGLDRLDVGGREQLVDTRRGPVRSRAAGRQVPARRRA